MRAIVQINSSIPCPGWLKLAEQHNIETIWFNSDADPTIIKPRWIVDGVHAFFFDSVDELCDKILHLKAHPDLAVSMGQAACNLVLEQGWTYTAWLERAISAANKYVSKLSIRK